MAFWEELEGSICVLLCWEVATDEAKGDWELGKSPLSVLILTDGGNPKESHVVLGAGLHAVRKICVSLI